MSSNVIENPESLATSIAATKQPLSGGNALKLFLQFSIRFSFFHKSSELISSHMYPSIFVILPNRQLKGVSTVTARASGGIANLTRPHKTFMDY